MNFARVWILLLVGSTAFLGKEACGQWPTLTPFESEEPVPGTSLLKGEDDFSYESVLANDRFLDRQIELAKQARNRRWVGGEFDLDTRRSEFVEILGLHRDQRVENPAFEFYTRGDFESNPESKVRLRRVRWPVLEGVSGEGWLLEPEIEDPVSHPLVIAIPDADQHPEELLGWGEQGSNFDSYPLRMAESGCRVLIPALVSREEMEFRMTRREWLHRPAFVLGRTLSSYEVHMILAGADALIHSVAEAGEMPPLGVLGWGEGGRLALFAAAIDRRFEVAGVSGYFGPRENLWREPAEHNLFEFVRAFGDAELGALSEARSLVIETGRFPDAGFRLDGEGEIEVLEERPAKNGKPGRFAAFPLHEVKEEFSRLQALVSEPDSVRLFESNRAFSDPALEAFLQPLGKNLASADVPKSPPAEREWEAAAEERENRIAAAIERHTQGALVDAAHDRFAYFSNLKTGNLEQFRETIEPYRDRFREEVIGHFDTPLISPNPRSRPYQVSEKTQSYEVVLDVFDGVFAYGILTVPRNLDFSSSGKLPVVVCQHGLEGTPQDLVGEKKFKAYQAFATRLAEEGYVTFAPQNGYKYFDRFRLQQFKAQSIGRTLFSIAVPQHEQITRWLASLPFVDEERIAFYGLSYGGKSAMRIPPLVERYCLSICSGDFNEWVWKNAATDPRSLRYSYTNKGEYEIFEWNLGGTFNYAEMASLICPRPFMVERGHFDGVAPDETVAYEFAKVRNLYQARLGLEGQCEIEWFPGPHAIRGEGTFQFLDRHLRSTKAR